MNTSIQKEIAAQLASSKQSIEALHRQLTAKAEQEATQEDVDVKIASIVASQL